MPGEPPASDRDLILLDAVSLARTDQGRTLGIRRRNRAFWSEGPVMRPFRPLRDTSPPAALPALLYATHLLGIALGSALGKLRDTGVTMARMFERAEDQVLLLRMAREAAAILGARWDKVPERQRPHYEPEHRFRILRILTFLGLSQRETAAMFRVSVETIARWEMETATVNGEAVRPLVAPNPPVRRFADVVRALVKTMELARFGGNDLIARTLARAGWKLSARTVGRIRKERWPAPRVPEAASTVPRAVRAKRPNHVWMVDLTDVKGLFSLVTLRVGVVFDAFSRLPLSAQVFSKEASALEVFRSSMPPPVLRDKPGDLNFHCAPTLNGEAVLLLTSRPSGAWAW